MNYALAAKRNLHVLLPLFLGSVIAYLDRVNVAHAALTMNSDLGFSTRVFGTGAGIFFVGYVLFSFGSIGGYVGPYLTGFVKDVTGSYHAAYIALAGMLLLSGVLMLTLGGRK